MKQKQNARKTQGQEAFVEKEIMMFQIDDHWFE